MPEGKPIDYKDVLADLEAKKAHIQSMIEHTKMLLGMSVSKVAGVPGQHMVPEPAPTLRMDTFFSMSVKQAFITYLRMSNKTPRSTQEIFDALTQGGLKASYATVTSQLSRAKTANDVVSPNRGMWGLPEWYNNAAQRK